MKECVDCKKMVDPYNCDDIECTACDFCDEVGHVKEWSDSKEFLNNMKIMGQRFYICWDCYESGWRCGSLG